MARKTTPVHIGIDTSKRELVVASRPAGTAFTVSNTLAGIADLVDRLARLKPVRIAIEPSGGYEHAVVQALRQAGLPVRLVNPRKLRQFAEAVRGLGKTDRLDADALAHYAETWDPPPPVATSPAQQELRDRHRWRGFLVELRSRVTTRRHQLRHAAARDRAAAILELLTSLIDTEALEMDALLSQDQTLHDQAALLRSAPGVGPVVARGLLAELPELGRCDRKALAAITGIAPYPRDSGAWHGKRHIRGGRRAPRNLLYLAALSATRSSSDLAACYTRLRARGKAPKLALLAVARKLLTRLNAMLRDHKPWATPAS